MVTEEVTAYPFLRGGGEMGALIRSKDWSETVIGDPGAWPQSLRTTLSILLSSKFPMFLWWGPDLIQFYNDGYRPSLGNPGKHPQALGQKGEDCWQEIWPVIKPLIDQVFGGGEATWSEDQLIPIYRNGHLEDVYWTFGYSPVQGEDGRVAGVLVVCHETTEKLKILKKMEMSEQHLSTAIRDIQEHEQRKDEFIRMASHELKTPVTSIKAYAQLLLSMVREGKGQGAQPTDFAGRAEEDDNRRFMQASLVTINKQVDKLTKLITEMLDLSRIESGQLNLNRELFSLSELIRETVLDFNRILGSQSGGHHQVLLTRMDAVVADAVVYADRDRIVQVINNLLANAVKYSPGADRVEISIGRERHPEGGDADGGNAEPGDVEGGAFIFVHVRDYGIGIDSGDHDKIFERFYRVEGKSEQTFPGFGIGLFIANDIIFRHGGFLSVKSEKGKGAVFTFSLAII